MPHLCVHFPNTRHGWEPGTERATRLKSGPGPSSPRFRVSDFKFGNLKTAEAASLS